jgi:hypothetical protein
METERATPNGAMSPEQEHSLPKWDRLRPPKREQAKPRERNVTDAILLDLVCSEEWSTFLRTVLVPHAATMHRNMVGGVGDMRGEAGYLAHIGGMKALATVIGDVYKKADIEIPEFLKVLLLGDFTV